MTQRRKYRLGFDIGGTFTDFVLVDESTGEVLLDKCLTTPADPARAVIEGLAGLLAKADLSGADIDIAIHATTLITNALIERKGARTALLTTEGFRDVLEMGTEVRYDIYDLFLEKPEPLVTRNWRFEVRERLYKDGNVMIPLDKEGVRAAARQMKDAGIESVAVAFLHAFRNPAHEEQARRELQAELADVTVSLSSTVAPEIREYERMSTTVANAYTQPLTQHYIDTLERGLTDQGYRRRLFLMISSGGVATAETARDLPIRMVESGPAAGVLAATYFGRSADLDALISFDMGGTTAKIGMVKDHQAAKTNMIEVGRVKRFKKGSGLPVKVPVIELIEIGAGGGSVAHIDKLGLLKVGPQSAGAEPGPACYGQGGEEPTVTDANVLLGYLDPDYFLGGTMKLDAAAARRAVETKLAAPLNLSVTAAARGIFEVVNQNMLSAMKVHIAERGEDPRKFFLFAFGGAGPAHAYDLARALQMKGVVVPPGAGATSAMGLVTAAVSFDYARSYVTRLDRVDWADLHAVFEAMASDGLAVLEDAGIAPDSAGVTVTHSMDLRHKGQGHELTVALPKEVYAEGRLERIAEVFYEHYRAKYGHAHSQLPVELITCRTTVGAPAPSVPQQPFLADAREGTGAEKGRRDVYFHEHGDFIDTPVYNRYALVPGSGFQGPAVIEERECTIVAGPSAWVRVDEHGNLYLDLEHSTASEATRGGDHEAEPASAS